MVIPIHNFKLFHLAAISCILYNILITMGSQFCTDQESAYYLKIYTYICIFAMVKVR